MNSSFEQAIRAAERDMGCKGIGTLREKSLHLALKYYFAPDPATHEQPVGGFVADAVTENGVVEIQTHGLSRLRQKLEAFLAVCPVTVVHPVAAQKYVTWVDENGEFLSRRRSPKHESVYSVMRELYGLRDWIANPRLRICLCELEIEEYRCKNGQGRDRKHHAERLDRTPLRLCGQTLFETPADYRNLLPTILPAQWTAKELSKLLPATEEQLRMLLNLLARMGVVETIAATSRSKQWRLTAAFSDFAPVSDAIRG